MCIAFSIYQRTIQNKPLFKVISMGHFEFKNEVELMEIFALANDGFPIPKF
jgi:hypothetical protein